MQTGKCSSRCEQGEIRASITSSLKRNANSDVCRPGETFCMDIGKCARKCAENVEPYGGYLETSDMPTNCPQGATFCLTTGKC